MRLSDLKSAFPDLIGELSEATSNPFDAVAAPEEASEKHLVFAFSEEDWRRASDRRCRNFAVPEQAEWARGIDQNYCRSSHLKELLGRVLEHFFPETPNRYPQGPISPKAEVAPSAILGPGVVIGAEARIEENVSLGPNVVVEDGVSIGAGTEVGSGTGIGRGTRIGKNCRIGANSCLGFSGFGLVQIGGRQRLIPQKGSLVIGDDVLIGNLCTVARGTLGATRIDDGVCMDDQIHVAHNCTIGEGSVFAAGFAMAGSSHIGKHCLFGGRAVVTDHVRICDGAHFAALAVVSKDVVKPGAYGGYPLRPLKEFFQWRASLPKIPEMRKDLIALRRRLDRSEEQK